MTAIADEQRCPVCGHDVEPFKLPRELFNSNEEAIPVTHRCSASFCGVLLNEVSPGQYVNQTLTLTNHYSICVLPFSYEHDGNPYAPFANSTRWKQRIFSVEREEDIDRTEYFLPYIRKFLFPTLFKTSTQATSDPSAIETCRHYDFDLSSISELNDEGKVMLDMTARDARKRLNFNYSLVIESIKLTMFNYGSGFLMLRFSSPEHATLFDQMQALQFLRPYAPLYAGFELPTLQFSQVTTRIPELLAFLLQEFDSSTRSRKLADFKIDQPIREMLPVKLVYDDRMMVYAFSCVDKYTVPDDVDQAESLVKRASILNVDSDQSLRATQLEINSIDDWVRLRWEGFTKDGTVLVVFNTDRYNERYLGQYQASYYFDIFLIAALQRVTLLTLFERLSDISGLTRNSRQSHQMLRRIRFDLLRFRNQCCFSQITNRARGQELSQKWHEVFENNTLMLEVNDQSEQLESYLKNRLHEQFEKLIRLGGFLATAVPAVLGMDLIIKASWVEDVKWVALVVLLIGTGAYASLILYRSRDEV